MHGTVTCVQRRTFAADDEEECFRADDFITTSRVVPYVPVHVLLVVQVLLQ